MTTRTLVLANAALEIKPELRWLSRLALRSDLLLGADLTSGGIVVGRFTGLALLSMGMACWPNKMKALHR